MEKNKFKKAIELQIKKYEMGDFFEEFNQNHICKLTAKSDDINCYRCPLNVTATISSGGFGCIVRRSHECPQGLKVSALKVKKAIDFNKKLLLLLNEFEFTSEVFHSGTKTYWAAAVRALDVIN